MSAHLNSGSIEWLAWGVTVEGRHAVYLSDDVASLSLEEDVDTEEIMSMGGGVVSTHSHLRGIDMTARVRGMEMAFSELSTAAAAATVGLTELLGALDNALRPQLELLYYACVDHIETPEEVEAFEVLAEYLGV